MYNTKFSQMYILNFLVPLVNCIAYLLEFQDYLLVENSLEKIANYIKLAHLEVIGYL